VETENDKRPTIYIFLNKSLQMSAGKAASQAVHAAASIILLTPVETLNEWSNSPLQTVIVLEARDEAHIRNISQYLQDRKLMCRAIIDEGATEVDPHSITALGVQVVDRNDSYIKDTFSSFNKYKDTIRVSMEVER